MGSSCSRPLAIQTLSVLIMSISDSMLHAARQESERNNEILLEPVPRYFEILNLASQRKKRSLPNNDIRSSRPPQSSPLAPWMLDDIAVLLLLARVRCMASHVVGRPMTWLPLASTRAALAE